jgi:hypothetical protein
MGPVRIRVKIGSQHPLACRKRLLNGGGCSDETGKTEAGPMSQQVWHNKDPSLLKGRERLILLPFTGNGDVTMCNYWHQYCKTLFGWPANVSCNQRNLSSRVQRKSLNNRRKKRRKGVQDDVYIVHMKLNFLFASLELRIWKFTWIWFWTNIQIRLTETYKQLH